MAETGFLVVARGLADVMLTGASIGGYTIRECGVCGAALCVSEHGMAQVNRGAHLFCNGCGVAMMERLRAAGQTVDVIQTSAAKAQLERLKREGKKNPGERFG